MDAISDSLQRRRITYVSHTTPCHRLPDIFRHAALLSLTERTARVIAEPMDSDGHYWGSADKKEAFAGFIICSFMPPWWMCRSHDDELAIILLDSVTVCTMPGTCYCPINSAYSEYPADDIKQRSGIEAFDACFPNPDTFMAGNAEIIVPSAIPLKAFRGIVFCDKEAHDYWLPILGEILSSLSPGVKPSQPIQVAARGLPGFRFPGDYAATRRVR
jgi:hypothetical protein